MNIHGIKVSKDGYQVALERMKMHSLRSKLLKWKLWEKFFLVPQASLGDFAVGPYASDRVSCDLVQ